MKLENINTATKIISGANLALREGSSLRLNEVLVLDQIIKGYILPSKIAEKTSYSRASVSRITSSLLNESLIKLSNEPDNDRRCTRYTITELGKSALKKAKDILDNIK